jgi:hypothetical protein
MEKQHGKLLEKAGKAICRIFKFWYRVLPMEQDELLKTFLQTADRTSTIWKLSKSFMK